MSIEAELRAELREAHAQRDLARTVAVALEQTTAGEWSAWGMRSELCSCAHSMLSHDLTASGKRTGCSTLTLDGACPCAGFTHESTVWWRSQSMVLPAGERPDA